MDSGTRVGRFAIRGELGRGSAFAVLRGAAPDGGPDVAIKVALPGAQADADLRARFERGARMQAAVAHPAIVRVLETGVDAAAGPYLVMELIDGPSLGAALAAGELDSTRALEVFAQIAAALDHVHAAGVVHRDVKPANVLVQGEQAWLADFGLARDEAAAPVTRTGALVGTLRYLAPEVIRGGAPTPAADRYAFAAMVYEALVGEPVFPRPTDAAVLFAHAEEEPPAPSRRRPELPAAVDPVLAGGLARDPATRPSTAAAFVAELADAMGGLVLPSPPTARGPEAGAETVAPVVVGVVAADGGADGVVAAGGGADGVAVAGGVVAAGGVTPARARRLRGVLAGAAGIAVVGAVAAVLLVDGGAEAPRADAAPVATVAPGLTVLGPSLAADDVASRDCRGRPEAAGNTPACTVLQRRLPDTQLVVPTDGALRAWSVRGTTGEVALQVLRRRAGEIFQVARSQPTLVPDAGLHRFPVELAVEAGDLLGLDVAPRAVVGVRPANGARVERWVGPVGSERGPGDPAGAVELQLRGEVEEGGAPVPPRQVTGARARDLPAGRELAASSTRLPDGRPVRIGLVLAGGTIYVDLFRAGQRRARIAVDDLDPDGRLVELKAFEVPDSVSQLNLIWHNPDVQARTEHYYGLDAESLEFYS